MGGDDENKYLLVGKCPLLLLYLLACFFTA